MLAVFVGRMIFQVGGSEQLVDQTIRVYPGHLHATGGFRATVVSDTAATPRDGGLFVSPLKRCLAAVQRSGFDATEHGRRLRRGYGRTTGRQAAREQM